ncbi:PR domain zinc finger protein 2 [Nelusetta ayraudi]|uniref:PR domain zinc finger protein 2 n=1 Tax=Nelusetta ayraudi TaxID=303726 RepID=UPI003F6F9375
MEDCPQLYIAEIAGKENLEEGEDEDISQEGAEVAPDRMVSQNTDFSKHVNQDPMSDLNSFPCQQCERNFASKQALERHMHIHTLASSEAHTHKSNRSSTSFGSNLGQQQGENMTPLDSNTSATHLHTSPPSGLKPSALLAGDPSAQPERQEESDGHYGCKYCEKVFTSHTNKRRHERRVHEQHVQATSALKTQLPEEDHHLQSAIGETSQHPRRDPSGSTASSAVPETEQAEQYMLDISSNISENLSIYIDGKIVSMSTVSSCESAEGLSGSSSLIRLDSLILDPCQEIDGQPLARRRTATPPLLPQIKTELESEVVVSSATSSLVCSLIENILPQSSESAVVQKERTVFLSPKLKQLLEKQDGLQPALALIADGQKPCSPVSLSVLPAGTGRFKRRTGSPPSSPTTIEETPTLDSEDCQAVSMVQVETQHTSLPAHQTASEKNDPGPSLEEPKVKSDASESWPPMKGGNSCNQQPLDLSNTLKRNEDKDEAVLDLSLQKTSLDKCEVTVNSVSPAVLVEGNPSAVMLGQDLLNSGEQNVDPRNPETPLVTDFTIVKGSDMIPPVEPIAERLIYGLALPPNSLNPTPASLASVALQPASSCAIAFATPVSHGILPTTPSIITVLAPPPIPNPTNQPIQVLTPNLSPEPLLICAENALTSSQCNLTPAFAAANPANLVALSQPLDPTLNIPGHVFLTDQITLNPPLVESAAPVSEVPFSPAMNLADPLINSYNTVLIECTIALEAPGSLVQPMVTLPENGVDSSAPPEVIVNRIEQIVTVANPPTVDPPVLVSSVTEPVTLATTASAAPDDPGAGGCSPEPKPDVELETPTIKDDEDAHCTDSSSPVPSQPSPSSAGAEGDESSSNTTSNEQPQTFAKNFTCNVCDKLFHSMKALGEHVGDHADEWPYKCEFCVLLFVKPSDLLDHRASLHGVGKAYVCSSCSKDFVYLSNLKQHQEELHPGQQCTYTEEEKGKLRPHNYNNSVKANNEPQATDDSKESQKAVKKEGEVDGSAEELLTTIKILASDGSKTKGPDVRLGINQHYPSFKPPPFPYHNRSSAVSVASATNFTTHNIPQTFSTAIRCTKCGKSFDNMPELHRHILACASASDKKRYTPKKNPIPLRHFAKTQNGGVLSTNGLNASNRPSQSQKSKPGQESSVKVKLKVLKRRKKQFVQRVMPQRNKSVSAPSRVAHARVEAKQVFVCPHCRRDFTMRRSRTKHMAVCPKKPKEAKKQKEEGISVTKENNGRLLRAADDHVQQAPPQHRTRFQTAAGSAKRHAVVPVQTVFSSKRSKIIIKESVQPKQEAPSLGDLPMVRTFSPSMRQYSRMPQRVKGIPIKITIVNSQQKEEEEELPVDQSREKASADVLGNLQQDPAV